MSSSELTDIFKKIDELDDVKSVRELISKIKPILAELAYYSLSGDGAIMEMRENWHTTFTNQIRGESSAQNTGSNTAGAAVSIPHIDNYQRPMFYSPSQTQRQTSLPSSLNAIMHGTHISFRDGNN